MFCYKNYMEHAVLRCEKFWTIIFGRPMGAPTNLWIIFLWQMDSFTNYMEHTVLRYELFWTIIFGRPMGAPTNLWIIFFVTNGFFYELYGARCAPLRIILNYYFRAPNGRPYELFWTIIFGYPYEDVKYF